VNEGKDCISASGTASGATFLAATWAAADYCNITVNDHNAACITGTEDGEEFATSSSLLSSSASHDLRNKRRVACRTSMMWQVSQETCPPNSEHTPSNFRSAAIHQKFETVKRFIYSPHV